jgi:hypothetical protein
MKSSLEISDYFILLFIAGIFGLGIYTIVKFMRSKD